MVESCVALANWGVWRVHLLDLYLLEVAAIVVAVPVVGFLIVTFARVIEVLVLAPVLTLNPHYRGGPTIINENKDLVELLYIVSRAYVSLLRLVTTRGQFGFHQRRRGLMMIVNA
ncbi:hypothetical protein Scep_009645 [Stephania cephalantha]|uniref:Uncharacterized protein n=1 Tax=Stephania cephalantha TaxID=152367 RepID=A0AAP0JU85_9MAGN